MLPGFPISVFHTTYFQSNWIPSKIDKLANCWKTNDSTVITKTFANHRKQELSENSMLDYSTAYLITEIMDSNVVTC